MERRERRDDLEVAKAHLEELVQQTAPYIRLIDNGNALLEMEQDLKKIDSALKLKDQVEKMQSLINEAAETVLRRPEDQKRLNQIHRELIMLDSRLENK